MARRTNKSPKLERSCKLWVKIKIAKAENIDMETFDPAKRFYTAFAWVGPMSWIRTNTVHGSPDPVWNVPMFMPLDELLNVGHMGLEIYRSSSDDPSTSTGKVLVARAVIPFRKDTDFNKQESYELRVLKGLEWVAGGSIIMTSEVGAVYD